MDKLKEYLIIGIIIIFTLGLYLLMPSIFEFIRNNSIGVRGAGFWSVAVGVLLVAYYLMGYRGRSLLYVLLLLVFIAACIWLYFNYRSVDTYITTRYGQVAATVVFLVLAVIIWLFTKLFL